MAYEEDDEEGGTTVADAPDNTVTYGNDGQDPSPAQDPQQKPWELYGGSGQQSATPAAAPRSSSTKPWILYGGKDEENSSIPPPPPGSRWNFNEPKVPVQPVAQVPDVSAASQFLSANAQPTQEQAESSAATNAQLQQNGTAATSAKVDAIHQKWDSIIAMAQESRPENVQKFEAMRNEEIKAAGLQTVDATGQDAKPFIPTMSGQDISNLTGLGDRAGKAVAALQNTVGGFANILTGPQAAEALNPANAPAYIAQMAASVPKSLAEAAGAYSGGDTDTGDQKIIEGLATAGLIALPLLHKGAKADLTDLVGKETADNLRQAAAKQGDPNASKIAGSEGVPQSEVRPPVGEEAPLRQQGEASGTREAGTEDAGSAQPQGEVPLKPTPDQLTKPENSFVSDGNTKPAVSAKYFHDAGDATKNPNWWVNFWKDQNGGNYYKQESAAQAGLYLRQLGDEDAAPVIKAMQDSRDQMSKLGKAARDKAFKLPPGDEQNAALNHPDFQVGMATQFPREAIEAARDEGSAKGTIPESAEYPLKKSGIDDESSTKAEAPFLDPEDQAHFDIERGNVGVPVKLSDASDPNSPFAQRQKGHMATIDRATGSILINGPALKKWMRNIAPKDKEMAMRSLLGEERIHLATDDESANTYWKNLSPAEQGITKRIYSGGHDMEMSDTNWGHEALRRRIQQLSRMTPRDVIDTAGKERWTVRGLTALEHVIRTVRKVTARGASREQTAMLDKVQGNIDAAKSSLNGDAPSARPKNDGELKTGQYWQHPDSTLEKAEGGHFKAGAAKMVGDLGLDNLNPEQLKAVQGNGGYTAPYEYMQSKGYTRVHVEPTADGKRILFSGNASRPQLSELKNLAIEKGATLIHDQNKKHTIVYSPEAPSARPKRRAESLDQDKFVLPGIENRFNEPPAGTERVTAEQAGALPRLTGPALDAYAAGWVGDQFKSIRDALAKGEHVVPKFSEFVKFMKGRNPDLQPGHLNELWQDMIYRKLTTAPDDELRAMVSSVLVPKADAPPVDPATGKIRTFIDPKTGRDTGEWLGKGLHKGSSIWLSMANKMLTFDPKAVSKIDIEPLLGNLADAKKKWSEKLNDAELSGKPIGDVLNQSKEEIDRITKAINKAKIENRATKTAEAKDQRGTVKRRNTLIGAIYKKLVVPKIETADLHRNIISLDDIRYGGGGKASAVQDFGSGADDNVKTLTGQLLDDSKRNSDDPTTYTKRLTVIQDRKTGETHMVSTYRRGDEAMLMDPAHPQKFHLPLQDMLRRYRVVQSLLLDQPVQRFKKSWKSLGDYQDDFGKEAKETNDHHEAGFNTQDAYDPQMYAGGQRITQATGENEGIPGSGVEEGAGGHLQGPFRSEIEAAAGGGHGALDRPVRGNLSTPENKSIATHLSEVIGHDPESPYEVHRALLELPKSKPSPTVLSGLRKLAQALEQAHPKDTTAELLLRLSQDLYEEHAKNPDRSVPQRAANTAAQNRYDAETRQLQQADNAAAQASKPAHGTSQDVTTPPEATDERSKPAMLNKRDAAYVKNRPFEPRNGQPAAIDKASLKPETARDSARRTDDSLYRLQGQHAADVEEAFPRVKEIGNQWKTMPEESPGKVFQSLEERTVLGKTDIKLTPEEEKMAAQAAAILQDNNAKYAALKQLNPDADQREVFPRIVKDPNSLFSRIVRGVKQGVTEGNILSKTAWFNKARIIKALIDKTGNRHVGVIAGTDGGRFIRYDKGKGEDLGRFANADVVKRHERMEKELEPIVTEQDALATERAILSKTPSRASASTVRLKNIDKKLSELEQDKQAVLAAYPMEELNDRTWADKHGKIWKVDEATTGEIERNMSTRFYKEPFSTLIAQNLKLSNMLRSAQWLEDFKQSPAFKQIARPSSELNLPPDWKPTSVPQLRGYVFEPRTADALDHFQERSKGRDPNILTATNRMLMNAIFFDNPFLHVPNLGAWWFTSRGAMSAFDLRTWPTMAKTFSRAFSDVANKTPDYLNYLAAGTPLQYTRMREFSQNLTRNLIKELGENQTLAKRVSNALGYANPFKLSQSLGHAATAGLHDILTLQLIYEAQARNPKLKPAEAIRKIAAVMPDYRVPARVLDVLPDSGKTGRRIARLIQSPNLIYFGAYHYSEGKAFINMAKGLAGKGDLTRGEALDKIAATALIAYVAYPLLNAGLQQITGRKDLKFGFSGSTTMPKAIESMVRGEKSPAQAMASFLTPAAGTLAATSLLFNKDIGGRGGPIYNWKGGAGQSAAAAAKYALGQLNPAQIGKDIMTGRYSWDQIFENMAGIRKDYSADPQHQVQSMAYDWAKSTQNEKLLAKFNDQSSDVFPPSQYTSLRNFLRNGDESRAKKEIDKLEATGVKYSQIEKVLRPSAHPLSGLLETEPRFVNSLNPDQLKVYDEAKAEQRKMHQNFLDWN